MDLIDERAVFAATFGTEFALELRARRAAGANLDHQLLASVAHQATTVARGAVQGLKAIGQLPVASIDDEVPF